MDALVQDAQQLHIHLLRDTDGKIHSAAGQGGGQVVAQVIVQQALGLVGVGVIGIDLTRAQGGQAIGKGEVGLADDVFAGQDDARGLLGQQVYRADVCISVSLRSRTQEKPAERYGSVSL